MEHVLHTLMIVDLYGTAPRYHLAKMRGERQNLRVISSFLGQKRGGVNFKPETIIRSVTYMLCLFSLFFV